MKMVVKEFMKDAPLTFPICGRNEKPSVYMLSENSERKYVKMTYAS